MEPRVATINQEVNGKMQKRVFWVDVKVELSLENLALNLALGNNVNSVPTKLKFKLELSLAMNYRTIIYKE